MSEPATPRRDDVYYWELVTFQVEDLLFRVPRHHFQKKSHVFRDMFALPQGDQEPEGNSDANPIKLEGILATEFTSLLRALYPRYITGKMDANIDWKSVLKLATLWEFLELRMSTVDKLSSSQPPMTAWEKIELGRRYFVHNWLRSGYVDLVSQPETLSKEEAETIGYAAAFSISRLREESRKKQRKILSSTRKIGYNNFYTQNYRIGKAHAITLASCSKCGTSAGSSCILCSGCVIELDSTDYNLELPKSEIEGAVNAEFRKELEDVHTEGVKLAYPAQGWMDAVVLK
ncbi:hypothetical protein D9758_005360 [Tetrapyrgos nigripes]|uniref:BTB domain-containing protein n=1 Tax=Tetrapyrgos nigripes TaxID=182062 RepID=A0A8H5GI60_9AGAR|nr:hypothetical protein D9758_005360 [Tetrapyrgos nigripes]